MDKVEKAIIENIIENWKFTTITDDELRGSKVETFWDAGKMTYEDGIVVTLEDGEEYYITVNKYE
jgi:hypothetical protein